MTSAFHIRPAAASDAAFITACIHALAEFEKLAHACQATEDAIRTSLFGPGVRAYALIAEVDSQAVGFAVYFYNYSTFLAKPGIYIEDAYIQPEHRSKGIGAALFRYLAKKAVEEGCGRLEWWVLDWNRRAIDFYERIGAVAMDAWTVQRIEGAALLKLARA